MTYVEFDDLDDQQQREVFRASFAPFTGLFRLAEDTQRVQLGVALNVSGMLSRKYD